MYTMNEFRYITDDFKKKIRDPEVRAKFKSHHLFSKWTPHELTVYRKNAIKRHTRRLEHLQKLEEIDKLF